jgi:hypothetical protein
LPSCVDRAARLRPPSCSRAMRRGGSPQYRQAAGHPAIVAAALLRIKRGRPVRRPRNQNVPSAHPQNPPTGPSHPIANCVHARANQTGPPELFGLLQVCHYPTQELLVKSRSALVFWRAEGPAPISVPIPRTPTRLGPSISNPVDLWSSIAAALPGSTLTVTARASAAGSGDNLSH